MKLNPAFVDRVVAYLSQVPLVVRHRISDIELHEDGCRFTAEITEEDLNPFHSVDGGIYAFLLDNVTGFATFCRYPADYGTSTLDLQATYARPFKTGKVVCEAHIIKAGRSVCMVRGDIEDEDGTVLAYATSNLFVGRGPQLMDDAVKAAGFPALPDKFIDDEC